jgi:hypothetical protein
MHDIQKVYDFGGQDAFQVEDRGRLVAIVPANIKGRKAEKVAAEIALLPELKEFVTRDGFVKTQSIIIALKDGDITGAQQILSRLRESFRQLKDRL